MPRDWMTPAIAGLANQFTNLAVPRVAAMPDQPTFTAPAMPDAPRMETDPNYYTPLKWDPSMGTGNQNFAFGARKAVLGREPEFAMPSMAGMGSDNLSEAGGEWATLDAMNDKIAQAAAQTGAPANLIKAMLAREGAFGTDKNVVGLRGEQVYAFNGIFRSTAESYGIDFDKMTQDDGYAIWAMGKVLSSIKANNNLPTWDDTAAFYFAGPNYKDPLWADEVGNTVGDYLNGTTGVVTNWKKLGGGAGGSWSGSWDSIALGGKVEDWGEFGKESSNGYYGYSTQYGMNGTQHTGVDIAGAWNETYRSPVSGTVTCAGTGNGPGAGGQGCAAFGTMDGKGGAGRIEVTLDDGSVLIFGHSQGSFVQPGQRINVGDPLGTIGWANSAHIHLEARVPDASMPSGYRIVDPRTVLGGWSGGANALGGNPYVDRWGPDMAGWNRWR